MTALTIRLHIALANLRRLLYDATHVPADPGMYQWAEMLHEWNAEPETLGGAYYIDGVLYRRRWWGLERVP